MANKGGGKGLGAGRSFTSDFSSMGTGRGSDSALLGGAPVDVLSEEKRLIEKVFAIVDKDNSGTIDTKELEEMFTLFGVDTQFLHSAVNRIMSNVDKDHDGQISPQEFYKLLSQKFEKGDPRPEMLDVFNRFDTKNDKQLDVEELHAVAHMLGENCDKKEVRDMIRTFKVMYDELTGKKADVKISDTKSVTTENEPGLTLSLDHWYFIMEQEL